MRPSEHRRARALGAALTVAVVAAVLGFVSAASAADDATIRGTAPANDASAADGFESAAAAAERGPVRVIVGLRAPFRPEGKMSSKERARQRDHIAEDQQAVLDEVGDHASRVRAYKTLPFMALVTDRKGLDRLRASDDVASVDLDTLAEPMLNVSTETVGADDMWTAGFEGNGQTVAILDTGVDKTHPFQSGRVVEEACYSDAGPGGTTTCPNGQRSQTGAGAGVNCNTATPGCNHGTHVAGIAAGADASVPTYGVARGSSIMSVQVFTKFTSTECGEPTACVGSWESDQIAGLERVYALRNSYAFAAVNMSLGGDAFTSPCDTSEPATKTAIDNLLSVGIPTVIATGNDGFTNAISSPGCISSAVSVGSTTANGSAISSFSNNHPQMTDLLAPGSTIRSSVPGGGYATFNGTSMATPHVAGAFALLRSSSPTATVADLLAALKATGSPVTDGAASPPYAKPLIKIFDAYSAIVGCVDDALEEDDGRGTATPIDASAPQSGKICPGDVDYVSFAATAGARIRAAITGTAVVTIEDAGGNALASSTPTVHEASAVGPADGTYFVKVESISGVAQSYELSVSAAHPLVVKVRGKGTVIGSGFSCRSECRQIEPDGSSVSLLPKAKRGYKFRYWTGDCARKTKQCTAQVDGPLTMTAVFKRLR